MISSGLQFLFLVFVAWGVFPEASARRPHILHIQVNNLVWADVGWRADDFRTPKLDQLRNEGMELTNYYTLPNGVTSRIAMATGKDPYKLGFKTINSVYSRKSNFSLSLDHKLLSNYLSEENYVTHLVGSWNLGFCSVDHTPLKRGYSGFYGSLVALNGHYSHESIKRGGYDFRRGYDVDWTAQGKYSTTLFTDHVVELINSYHSNSAQQEPLFISLAYDAIHRPLQAPQTYLDKCSHVAKNRRRRRCAMMAAVDEGVAKVMDAFKHNNEDDNLLVLFTSVNGGPHRHGSSNAPLRGFKHTLYEGGSRVPAFVYSKTLLPNSSSGYSGLMHATDILPTLMEASEADPSRMPQGIDGKSLWKSIVENGASPRKTIIYDVDVEAGLGAIRHGKWKLIYNSTCVNECKTWELYDLESDPSEGHDLSEEETGTLEDMKNMYNQAKTDAVPHQTYVTVPRSEPANWNGTWSPYGCWDPAVDQVQ